MPTATTPAHQARILVVLVALLLVAPASVRAATSPASPPAGHGIAPPARPAAGLVTGDIEGRVLAKRTGRPVPNAKVVVLSLHYSVTPDSSGHYRIAGVPVGSQELRALAPEMDPAPATVEVRAGRIAQADFALEPYRPPAQGSALGKITRDAGTAPLAHAFVATPGVLDPGTLEDGGVRATEAGIFLASDLLPGWQDLRVSAMGYADTLLRVFVVDGRTTLVFLDVTRARLGGAPPAALAAPASTARPADFEPLGALGDTSGTGADSLRAPERLPDSLLVGFEVAARENDAASPRDVLVAVFDRGDREVRSLATLPLAPGRYLIPWDGKDNAGRPVPAGFYRLRVRAGREVVFERPVPTPR